MRGTRGPPIFVQRVGSARRTFPDYGTGCDRRPHAIGPDGTVRLRCYLLQADTVWFSADCGHARPIGIRATIRLMGSGGAISELQRCRGCTGAASASRPKFRNGRWGQTVT